MVKGLISRGRTEPCNVLEIQSIFENIPKLGQDIAPKRISKLYCSKFSYCKMSLVSGKKQVTIKVENIL